MKRRNESETISDELVPFLSLPRIVRARLSNRIHGAICEPIIRAVMADVAFDVHDALDDGAPISEEYRNDL